MGTETVLQWEQVRTNHTSAFLSRLAQIGYGYRLEHDIEKPYTARGPETYTMYGVHRTLVQLLLFDRVNVTLAPSTFPFCGGRPFHELMVWNDLENPQERDTTDFYFPLEQVPGSFIDLVVSRLEVKRLNMRDLGGY